MVKISDLVNDVGNVTNFTDTKGGKLDKVNWGFAGILYGGAGEVEIAGAGDTDGTGTENEQAKANIKALINRIAEQFTAALGIDSKDDKIKESIDAYKDSVCAAVHDWSKGDDSDNYGKLDNSPLSDIMRAYASSTGWSDQSDHLMVNVESLTKKVMSLVCNAMGAGDLSYSASNYTSSGQRNATISSGWVTYAVSTVYERSEDGSIVKDENDKSKTKPGYTITAWENALKAKFINGGYGKDMSWNKALSIAKGQADPTNETEGGSGKINVKGYYNNLYKALKDKGWIVENSSDVDKKIQDGEYKVAGRDIHYTALYEEVPDEETRDKAEAYYNQEMKKINRKEKQLDNELTKLNTEYSALSNDYNSVKGILEANIQRSFTYCQTG